MREFKPEAVIDASVWIALSLVAHIDLLPLFFTKVYLPQAVHQEILRGTQRPGIAELRETADSWLVLVESEPALTDIPPVLGAGEREVLSIAVRFTRSNTPIVALLDDLLARRWAQQRGISVLGTLGILKMARETGAVHQLEPLLKQLAETGFRMKRDLYTRLMRQVGELASE